MDKGISHVLSMSILLYGLQRPIFNSQDKEPYSFVGLKAQEKTGLLLMPTAKVTKNVSAAEGGGNVLCSILISIKTKAWLYSFRHSKAMHMLEADINLVYIRDFLGHSSTTTTELYARASEKMKNKALSKLDPTIVKDGKSSWQKDKGLMAYLKDLQNKY